MVHLQKICVLLFLFLSAEAKNIGLLIVATGKYICFVDPLIESARKHFCCNHRVTYFVFTDRELEPSEDVVLINQPRLGWPYDTMMRYQAYWDHRHRFLDQDYLFACDADMLFVGDMGDEILGKRVATLIYTARAHLLNLKMKKEMVDLVQKTAKLSGKAIYRILKEAVQA